MYDDINVFYSGNSGELGGMVFGPNFTASCADAPLKNTGEGMADFFLGLPTAFGRGLTSGGWEQTSSIYRRLRPGHLARNRPPDPDSRFAL